MEWCDEWTVAVVATLSQPEKHGNNSPIEQVFMIIIRIHRIHIKPGQINLGLFRINSTLERKKKICEKREKGGYWNSGQTLGKSAIDVVGRMKTDLFDRKHYNFDGYFSEN